MTDRRRTMHPVAVVTVVRGRRDHLARQRHHLGLHSPGVRHVIVDMGGAPIESSPGTVVVDFTQSVEAALPLAAARNLGAAHADADVLIFLDVDCIPTPRLVPVYGHRTRRHGGVWSGPVGYLPPSDEVRCWDASSLCRIAHFHDGRPQPGQAPTSGHPPAMFWSLSFALSSRTFHEVGCFDESFVGYGAEDTDFARSVADGGVALWFDGEATSFHQHHPVSSPPVEHLDDIVTNATRYHDKWGEWPMSGWLSDFDRLGSIRWTPDCDAIERVAEEPNAR